jgi:hypothetical protein
MRYAPVGFGLNGGGIIGDSSDEEDQSGSDSDGRGKSPKFQKPSGAEDGASDSDVVMEDAQPTPTPAKKSKSKKSTENSAENGDRPLKRKHKDQGEKKKKHKRLSPKPETTFSGLTTYQRRQTKLRHNMTEMVLFLLNQPRLHHIWDRSSQNYSP